MANTKNKISLFAPNAGSSSSADAGTFYLSDNWEDQADRKRGVVTGAASSTTFNTALRQSALMASILAEGLVNRFNQTITADGNASDLNQLVTTFGARFSKGSFILGGEVDTNALSDDAVTTDKILDRNVTASKLADIVPNKQSVTSANGITAKLSQDTTSGLSLRLDCASVTNSDTVKVVNNTNPMYLCGKLVSTSDNEFESIRYDKRVKVDSTGQLVCNNAVEASSFNATSDIRLKEHIVPSQMPALEIVDAIDIVDFNFKQTPNVKQFGVIAQALQAVCPDAVVEGEDGYLRVKESKLVYILWKALQDANARIAHLESIIKEK